MTQPAAMRDRLRAYALSLPEARLDHPWGDDVVKVGKKIVVFFGVPDVNEASMTVKLPESNALALAQPGVEPSRYNLGNSGWVTVRLSEATPFEMLREWIDESYRALAPRRLVAMTGHDVVAQQR